MKLYNDLNPRIFCLLLNRMNMTLGEFVLTYLISMCYDLWSFLSLHETMGFRINISFKYSINAFQLEENYMNDFSK